MSLNQKQIQILQAIQEGCSSDAEISQHLNLDAALVGYYLEHLQNEGYLYFYNHEFLGGSRKVNIELENKGKVAINNPNDLI